MENGNTMGGIETPETNTADRRALLASKLDEHILKMRSLEEEKIALEQKIESNFGVTPEEHEERLAKLASLVKQIQAGQLIKETLQKDLGLR